LIASLALVMALVACFVQVYIAEHPERMGGRTVHVTICATLICVADRAVLIVLLHVISVVEGNLVSLVVFCTKNDEFFNLHRFAAVLSVNAGELGGGVHNPLLRVTEFATRFCIPVCVAPEALAMICGLQAGLSCAIPGRIRRVTFLARWVSRRGRNKVVAVFAAAAHSAHQGVLRMVEVDRLVDALQFIENQAKFMARGVHT